MKIKNFNIEDKLIDILFQDDSIIVINKRNGLLSHCIKKENSKSVVSLLKEKNIKLYEGDDNLRSGIVHRLDKDTSGLMVLAKNFLSYKSLTSQFHDRKIIKRYKAYSWGVPVPIAGIINKPISNYLNKKKTSLEGKNAITEYKVIQNFKNI